MKFIPSLCICTAAAISQYWGLRLTPQLLVIISHRAVKPKKMLFCVKNNFCLECFLGIWWEDEFTFLGKCHWNIRYAAHFGCYNFIVTGFLFPQEASHFQDFSSFPPPPPPPTELTDFSSGFASCHFPVMVCITHSGVLLSLKVK